MTQILRTYGPNAAVALLYGVLAAVINIALGRHSFDLVTVSSVVVSSYILSDKRGWLTQEGGAKRGRLANHGPAALYAVMVALYMVATDDRNAPLMPALYLPVILAVMCYKLRAGLAVSVGMAALYVLHTAQSRPHMAGDWWQDLGAVFTFPVSAAFVGLLALRMEARFHALRDRTSELSALLDMSQMMDSAADLDTTLNLVLLNVERLSGCQVCAVYLKSERGDALELRAASGPRQRLTLAPMLAVRDARAGFWSVDETDQPEAGVAAFYAAETQAAPESLVSSRLFELDRRAASFAVVPLTSVEGLIGLLYVGYDAPGGLDPDAVHRLENLAVRAAFSLQRSVSQQGFQSLAYSDAMTGLDNFRRFEQDLADEMRRAERYARPLSVILLDIDHFKTFNDTLGHQAGDALLAQLASVLRNSLRSVDKPARYGGEEFVVVCPETGPDEARLIAERIRRNVETTAFALLAGDGEAASGGTTHVTVSVGSATFPQDAAGARDLVKCADDALYAAKHAGRNAVRAYEDFHLAPVAA